MVFATVVTVDFEYVLKSSTGETLWQNRLQMQYSPQQQAPGGCLAVMLLSALIEAAVARAELNYMPLTQQANAIEIAGEKGPLPLGPYRLKQ